MAPRDRSLWEHGDVVPEWGHIDSGEAKVNGKEPKARLVHEMNDHQPSLAMGKMDQNVQKP